MINSDGIEPVDGHRSDRLAGLGLLLAEVAGLGDAPPPSEGVVVVSGVPDEARNVLRDHGLGIEAADQVCVGRNKIAGLVVLRHHDDLAALLTSPDLQAADPVMVLRRTGPPIRVPRGYRIAARFGAVGAVDSPTHLIRLECAGARRWFADSVRPVWGPAGRLGRQLGRGPLLPRAGFPVEALLLTLHTGGSPAGHDISSKWVGPQVDGPAVIALGGGPTSGRSVLSYTGPDGKVVRHVKIDLADRANVLLSEMRTLQRLTGAAGVPTPGRTARDSRWVAVEQSHLPGISIQRRWRTGGASPWSEDVDEVLQWLLRTTVPRSLVHGDLWPDNIVRDRGRLGVFDWESAGPGDPLSDALGILITAARTQRSGSRLAEAALAVLTVDGWCSAQTPRRLQPFLIRSDGAGPIPGADWCEHRVLDQLEAIGRHPPPGGAADGRRTVVWRAAAEAVADSWRHRGSPWRVH